MIKEATENQSPSKSKHYTIIWIWRIEQTTIEQNLNVSMEFQKIGVLISISSQLNIINLDSRVTQ